MDHRVPEAFSKLIEWLLEKDANHRPQSAHEVITELQRLRGLDGASCKILFVDDEADFEVIIRQSFRRQVRKGELVVEFARDGEQALAKIHQDPGNLSGHDRHPNAQDGRARVTG